MFTGDFKVLDTFLEIVDIVNASLEGRIVRMNSRERLGGMKRTCRIASLCISCPWQAGIISFRVENSSFIFDLRRRSIKLCAVFLAIFRPAALVALGCFFLEPAGAAPLAAFVFPFGEGLAEVVIGFGELWVFGFI